MRGRNHVWKAFRANIELRFGERVSEIRAIGAEKFFRE